MIDRQTDRQTDKRAMSAICLLVTRHNMTSSLRHQRSMVILVTACCTWSL